MTTEPMLPDLMIFIQKCFVIEPDTREWKVATQAWHVYTEAKQIWAAERLALKRAEGKMLNGEAGRGFKLTGRRGSRKRVPDPAARVLIDAITRWHEGEGLSFGVIRRRLLERGVLIRGRRPSISWVRRAYWASVARQVGEAASGPDGGG
jgi:hypothetical protein